MGPRSAFQCENFAASINPDIVPVLHLIQDLLTPVQYVVPVVFL